MDPNIKHYFIPIQLSPPVSALKIPIRHGWCVFICYIWFILWRIDWSSEIHSPDRQVAGTLVFGADMEDSVQTQLCICGFLGLLFGCRCTKRVLWDRGGCHRQALTFGTDLIGFIFWFSNGETLKLVYMVYIKLYKSGTKKNLKKGPANWVNSNLKSILSDQHKVARGWFSTGK